MEQINQTPCQTQVSHHAVHIIKTHSETMLNTINSYTMSISNTTEANLHFLSSPAYSHPYPQPSVTQARQEARTTSSHDPLALFLEPRSRYFAPGNRTSASISHPQMATHSTFPSEPHLKYRTSTVLNPFESVDRVRVSVYGWRGACASDRVRGAGVVG